MILSRHLGKRHNLSDVSPAFAYVITLFTVHPIFAARKKFVNER
jgi:hypothetical protein